MDQFEQQPRKKVRIQYEENEEQLEQKEQYEQQEEELESEFNEVDLEKLLHDLQKVIQINQDQRMKYADDPQRFIDSEMELNHLIRQLSTIPAYPQYYSVFYNSHSFIDVIELMQHENSDIVIKVIEFFKELISPDNDAEVDSILELYNKLAQNNFFANLTNLILRMSIEQQEERQIIYNSFEIIETMVELKSSCAKLVGIQPDFMKYLCKLIEVGSEINDELRNYASELLVILLSKSNDNSKVIGECGGIDNLLILLSKFRKENPKTMEEQELVFNVFDALTLILLSEENQHQFQTLEGIQLLLKLIKAKNILSYNSYLLLLLAIKDSQKNCELLVELGGLSLVCPILLRKCIKGKTNEEQQKIDETTTGILRDLFRYTSEVYNQRVAAKCFEKLDDILKLRQQYMDQLPQIDQNEELDDQQIEDRYNELSSKGLLVIQNCDVVLFEMLVRGVDIKMNAQELILSIEQLISDNQEDKEYYQGLLNQIEVVNEEQ